MRGGSAAIANSCEFVCVQPAQVIVPDRLPDFPGRASREFVCRSQEFWVRKEVLQAFFRFIQHNRKELICPPK